MPAPLDSYNAKRNFNKTAEPSGVTSTDSPDQSIFVVQKHDATNLHYDFRLAHQGVLLSWAVPKGPSFNPADKRLAIQVEDHPYDYKDFEGIIAKGQYGGGVVQLWDQGSYQADGDMTDMIEQGEIKFTLQGERLKGRWLLVRLKQDDTRKNWLLIKEKDQFSQTDAAINQYNTSVVSGRSLQQIGPQFYSQTKQIEVQLASLAERVPERGRWGIELKYDGYRIVAIKDGTSTILSSRNHQNYSDKFPSIRQKIASLSASSCIIDGEVVVYKDGKTDFQALQNYIKNGVGTPSYMAFDLLELNGENLRDCPLAERKAALASLLSEVSDTVHLSNHSEQNWRSIYETVCQSNREGIIAKKLDKPYRAGRSNDWLKVKCQHTAEFVIVGYSQTNKRSLGLSSLLLASYQDDALIYRGRVGSGFSDRQAGTLEGELQKIKRKTAPLQDAPHARANETLYWVKPQKIAEVRFAGWTKNNLLRHASFKGLRQDKNAKTITGKATAPSKRSVPVTKTSSAEQSGQDRIILTSPQKEMFAGVSKRAVLTYYQTVGALIMPFARHRLIALLRCPDGRQHNCFFQKHPSAGFNKIKSLQVRQSDGKCDDYLYFDSLAGLEESVQFGTIELHGWGSTIEYLEQPDWLVFDLDPDENMALDQIRQGVRDLKAILDQLKLTCYLKTSGGKGYHVVVPLQVKAHWPEVRKFAKNVALAMATQWPKRYTANMSKQKRRGKIYIDWLRNTRGASSVLPYSLRARRGAALSWPISWQALDQITPQTIRLDNYQDYLSDRPWQNFFNQRQSIN